MKTPPDATGLQRLTLKAVRERFADQGYLIFETPTPLKRHPLDFVAVHKDNTSNMAVVWPSRKGCVLIASYINHEHHSPAVRDSIRRLQRANPRLIRWMGQRKLRVIPADWRDYFDPPLGADIPGVYVQTKSPTA